MAEIAFEVLAAGLEAVRGTAIAPTAILPFKGSLAPMEEEYIPDESRGTLHEQYRSAVVRRWSEWEGEGGADAKLAPFVFSLWAKYVAAPTTPATATITRRWEYIDLGTSDGIKTATMLWKDPNDGKVFQAPFCYLEELTISSDSSGTDGVTWSGSGWGQALSLITTPAMPAQLIGSILIPARKKVFLDLMSGTIGTTQVNDVVSVETTMSNNISPKFFDNVNLTYTRIGRGKRSMTQTFVMEYNEAIYNQTQAIPAVPIAFRVRYEGDVIEGAFLEYIEADTYGRLKFEGWEENFDTNRGMRLSVTSRVNPAIGSGWRLAAQNTQTTV